MASTERLLLLLLLVGCAWALCPSYRCRCAVIGNRHHIDCLERNLEEIPKDGSDAYEEMVLTRNKLKNLDPYSFENYGGLVTLNLSYNFIIDLKSDSLKGLISLQHLDLSNNSIVYVHSQFLFPTPSIQWLSLAKNEYIGKEISKADTIGNNATWLVAPSLRTLVLSHCQLTMLPPWVVAGLPGLEDLDLRGNRLKILPVLSVVSVCRLKSIHLAGNPFSCERYCENAVTKKYFSDNRQISLSNYTFCSATRQGCILDITEDENITKTNCFLQEIPKPQPRKQPRSVWLYIGAASGCLVGMLFLAMLFNAVVSTCRREESPPASPKSPHTRDVQQELREILSRPENHYNGDELEPKEDASEASDASSWT